MTIIFPIDDFLFELFPVEKGNLKDLEGLLKKFYADGPFEANIEITDEFIKITLETKPVSEDKATYKRVIDYCDKGQFDKAKPLIYDLIDRTPNISEYYRILGQILSEEANQDEAINCLIDALRWNPENEWALLMMGNIFAKYKKDIDTALIYYNQILEVKPDDYIALTNIGANLMQIDRADEAIQYFEESLAINPDYPNTHHALALIAEKQMNYESAFEHALDAIKVNPKKDGLYGNSFKLAVESATKLSNEEERKKGIVEYFLGELEEKGGKKIKIEVSDNIETAAKIEFAENYNRDYHLVKYNSKYPTAEHLVMHELMHLELVIEAKEANNNELLISTQALKSNFLNSLEKYAVKLRKDGVPDENITNYLDALFDGINRQVYNTPIDLFIEDRIFNYYPNFRPIQFLSLLSLIKEGIEATTSPAVIENIPKAFVSKSKIYNLVNTLHFKTLFNIDLTQEHNPTRNELIQANAFYDEFKEYRADKEPGEEYQLIQNWGEDLDLDSYFELVSEKEHRGKGKSIEQVLSGIEKDPFDLETIDPSKERKMKEFLDEHGDKELNMAVVMYMVNALQYFKDMPNDKIKEIAFEFATLGMSGIDPNKDGYIVPSFEGQTFTGYKVLAYFYVSWAISSPEVLPQLQMPFDKEYDMAIQLNKM